MQDNKLKMQQKIKINEGDIFLVPLRKKGYAIGLIIRKKGSILLGYFWDIKMPSLDSKFDKSLLNNREPILIKMFGDLGLKNGEWPIIDNIPSFNREDWSVPLFIRNISLVGEFLVDYDDDLNETKLTPTLNVDSKYNEDGIAGYGWIEIRLTKLIEA